MLDFCLPRFLRKQMLIHVKDQTMYTRLSQQHAHYRWTPADLFFYGSVGQKQFGQHWQCNSQIQSLIQLCNQVFKALISPC